MCQRRRNRRSHCRRPFHFGDWFRGTPAAAPVCCCATWRITTRATGAMLLWRLTDWIHSCSCRCASHSRATRSAARPFGVVGCVVAALCAAAATPGGKRRRRTIMAAASAASIPQRCTTNSAAAVTSAKAKASTANAAARLRGGNSCARRAFRRSRRRCAVASANSMSKARLRCCKASMLACADHTHSKD